MKKISSRPDCHSGIYSYLFHLFLPLLSPKTGFFFQHDTVAGAGAGQEAKEYYERTGERTRWTNALFGGMPTYQMSRVTTLPSR